METKKMEFGKEEYIKIYEYKRVKVKDTIYDVLRLDDIASANKYESESEYDIESGKYKDRKVAILFTDEGKEDFYCLPLTTVEKNLMTDMNPDDKEKITYDNYLAKCPNAEYQVVEYLCGRPILKILTDDAIKEHFKYAASPSVNESLLNIIGDGTAQSFTIDPTTISKIVGKENALTLQDPNKNIRSLSEFDIGSKYTELKKKLVGLDEQLKILLANITKNISLSVSGMDKEKTKELKSSLLIHGPAGSGKTFMITSSAGLFNVPYVIEDATRYSPVAYKGSDIEDILLNLYRAAHEDKEAFEHGIIFIDEFDKICKYSTPEDYAVKQDTQNSLLTLMQGTVIHKTVRKGLSEVELELDTSNITFVLSGAFEGILNEENVDIDDLVDYGMIRQLAGRIKQVIRTTNPTKEQLKEALLNSEFSYLKLIEEYFSIYNIKLDVSPEFMDAIVEEAYNKKSGYRGLSAAITKCINDVLFDVYSSKQTVVKLQIK